MLQGGQQLEYIEYVYIIPVARLARRASFPPTNLLVPTADPVRTHFSCVWAIQATPASPLCVSRRCLVRFRHISTPGACLSMAPGLCWLAHRTSLQFPAAVTATRQQVVHIGCAGSCWNMCYLDRSHNISRYVLFKTVGFYGVYSTNLKAVLNGADNTC